MPEIFIKLLLGGYGYNRLVNPFVSNGQLQRKRENKSHKQATYIRGQLGKQKSSYIYEG